MTQERERLRIRQATPEDLPRCETIWRTGIDDYLVRLGIPPLPAVNPSIGRLHRHTLSTDPERFVVAELASRGGPGRGRGPGFDGDGTERAVGFASAIRRGHVWFLSMLFVDPAVQGRGVGRRLLDAVIPGDGATLATATDAAQPISNGLYARLGIVPRMPLLNLVGRPAPRAALPLLPDGVTAAAVASGQDGIDASLAAEIDELDREVLGFAHPDDHGFVRREQRTLFVYRDASGRLLGYGYTSAIGRISPIAVRDRSLLAPVLAHLLGAIEPRGASAIWLPGDAGEAVAMALRAGLRLEGFPVLEAFSRPFADFARYVPISPGLL